jgi:hypothetical protein
MSHTTTISREQFMAFFRDDEMLNQLSVDDRLEIFESILIGNSDFTAERLQQILNDYQVEHIEIIERSTA